MQNDKILNFFFSSKFLTIDYPNLVWTISRSHDPFPTLPGETANARAAAAVRVFSFPRRLCIVPVRTTGARIIASLVRHAESSTNLERRVHVRAADQFFVVPTENVLCVREIQYYTPAIDVHACVYNRICFSRGSSADFSDVYFDPQVLHRARRRLRLYSIFISVRAVTFFHVSKHNNEHRKRRHGTEQAGTL